MKRWQNILAQAIATAAQGMNIWADIIPDDVKIYIAMGIATAQLVVANIAHSTNPDGTKAAAPYVKKLS